MRSAYQRITPLPKSTNLANIQTLVAKYRQVWFREGSATVTPNRPEALMERAMAAIKTGKTDEAVQLL